MRYVLGCDLGQAGDYTTTAVMERIPAEEDCGKERYVVRNLSRAPLHTPYTTIAPNLIEQAIELDGMHEEPPHFAAPMRKPPRPLVGLVLDATGVGRPVVDMARQAMREARSTPAGSRMNLRFKAVNVTGGNTEAPDGHGFINVPKKNLITSAAALVQDGRLEIPKDVEHRDVLLAELRDYRRRVNIATGHVAFEPWRSDQHDDLLFSVCLCTWLFTRPEPEARGMRIVSF